MPRIILISKNQWNFDTLCCHMALDNHSMCLGLKKHVVILHASDMLLQMKNNVLPDNKNILITPLPITVLQY